MDKKKIIMPSAAETRHAAEPRPYSAAKPRYPCCSTGISTSICDNRNLVFVSGQDFGGCSCVLKL